MVYRLIDGNRVQRRVIETGIHREGNAEVVSGLELGDRVVARGHHALVDGTLVMPTSPDGAGPPAVAGGTAAGATP